MRAIRTTSFVVLVIVCIWASRVGVLADWNTLNSNMQTYCDWSQLDNPGNGGNFYGECYCEDMGGDCGGYAYMQFCMEFNDECDAYCDANFCGKDPSSSFCNTTAHGAYGSCWCYPIADPPDEWCNR